MECMPYDSKRAHALQTSFYLLGHANRLVQRMAYIVGAAYTAGAEYIIENPPHRGDASFDYLFMHAQHAALWQMPIMKTLTDATSAKLVTFAQCMFGADSQKYTSFLHSSGFEFATGYDIPENVDIWAISRDFTPLMQVCLCTAPVLLARRRRRRRAVRCRRRRTLGGEQHVNSLPPLPRLRVNNNKS